MVWTVPSIFMPLKTLSHARVINCWEDRARRATNREAQVFGRFDILDPESARALYLMTCDYLLLRSVGPKRDLCRPCRAI